MLGWSGMVLGAQTHQVFQVSTFMSQQAVGRTSRAPGLFIHVTDVTTVVSGLWQVIR